MKMSSVAGVLLSVLCVILLPTLVFNCRHTREFLEGGRTQGTVEEVQENGAMCSVAVRFADAAGVEHVARGTVKQGPDPIRAGDAVGILYRRGKPGDARVGAHWEADLQRALGWAIAAIIVCSGFPVFLAASWLVRTRSRDAGPLNPRALMWFRIRMGALGLAFGAGVASLGYAEPAGDDGIALWELGLCVALTALLVPVMIAGLVGVVALFSGRARTWHRPTHGSPPFSVQNPLLFVHVSAWLAIAYGLGMLVTAFLGGPDQLMEGLGTFVGGMGCYAGVRLGMKLCAHKMMKEEA